MKMKMCFKIKYKLQLVFSRQLPVKVIFLMSTLLVMWHHYSLKEEMINHLSPFCFCSDLNNPVCNFTVEFLNKDVNF